MDKLLQKDFVLSFYGDDFTGSTDTMESLALNGVRTALFLHPPTEEEVRTFQLRKTWDEDGDRHLQAFGMAGVSRSLPLGQMKEELTASFARLSRIETDFFHYKVCSTFDSAPEIGSIGYATELAHSFYNSDFIPLVVGAPFLNRFAVFGNLFARIDGITYRLDRHPTMSRHPVTPMRESDLRLHLGRQTSRRIALMDLFALEGQYGMPQDYFNQLKLHNGDILLFDTLTMEHLIQVGALIVNNRSTEACQLIVGSSSVEYALCFYLHESGKLRKPSSPESPGVSDQILAMSGSAAPTTEKQIRWAIEQGFEDIRIDSRGIVHPERSETEVIRVTEQALKAIARGKSVIMYTALGPDDPIIDETKLVLSQLGMESGSASIQLGSMQGKILKNILEETGKMRTVVCGGDTSGHVARALGIYALETLMPIAPGAPLCIAHSKDPFFDGLEISLKGGQNGTQAYIGSIKAGRNIEK